MVSPGGPVTAYSCSPCGSLIAGGVAGDVIVWQASTGLQVTRLTGHLHDVTSVAFTNNAASLASADEDGHVRLHQVAATTKGNPCKVLQVTKYTA
jgi:WD40 repeat protein